MKEFKASFGSEISPVMELDDAIHWLQGKMYIPKVDQDIIRKEYAAGSGYRWRLYYGFSRGDVYQVDMGPLP